jgi:hypothetical protein
MSSIYLGVRIQREIQSLSRDILEGLWVRIGDRRGNCHYGQGLLASAQALVLPYVAADPAIASPPQIGAFVPSDVRTRVFFSPTV